MIRIIVVDDHAVVRKGLKQILDETPDLQVVDEAGSGFELIEKIKTNDYDLILLDISMPGIDGLDTLKEIKRIKPECNVLIFTVFPEDQYAVRVLKAGASGYINKESEPELLIEAIRKIASGGKFITPLLAEYLAYNLDISSSLPLHEKLSDREFQVMCMLAKAKTVKEISDTLSLSINTIHTYRMRILEKMEMKSNVELTHYALKNQLID